MTTANPQNLSSEELSELETDIERIKLHKELRRVIEPKAPDHILYKSNSIIGKMYTGLVEYVLEYASQRMANELQHWIDNEPAYGQWIQDLEKRVAELAPKGDKK